MLIAVINDFNNVLCWANQAPGTLLPTTPGGSQEVPLLGYDPGSIGSKYYYDATRQWAVLVTATPPTPPAPPSPPSTDISFEATPLQGIMQVGTTKKAVRGTGIMIAMGGATTDISMSAHGLGSTFTATDSVNTITISIALNGNITIQQTAGSAILTISLRLHII